MKTRLIGDIHGRFNEYVEVAREAEGPSIQVGDFGVGFGQGQYWHDRANEFADGDRHRFIRGNHDNPTKLSEMVGWIPDGLIENDVMFIGGAWSIDHQFRVPGVSWWPDEECSIEKFYELIDTYAAVKPRIMITHDAPISVTDEMFIQTGLAIGGKNAKSIRTLTGLAFETMFEVHQPDIWFFGHWHKTMAVVRGRTTFQCIGELDFIDIDLSQ